MPTMKARTEPLSDTRHSISDLIPGLKKGEQAAIEGLWLRYFPLMVRVASRRLGAQLRRALSADDVATEAFLSFCEAVARPGSAERFPRLHNRGNLWGLLATFTARRACRKPTGWLPGVELTDEPPNVREPDPGFALAVTQLLNLLDGEKLRQVAEMKMAGYKNAEIARKIERSISNVELKLKRIRSIWGPHLEAHWRVV